LNCEHDNPADTLDYDRRQPDIDYRKLADNIIIL